ncbi:glycoside hydrolase family 16 protein [Tortispora caseinolytica NRRL Y-17796]|uniref:Glycoside hydrolase family 16 protein n=1 Tax=Tortispora caseinolytica NRRL Y-17796 TaxID=767744 RepID=A0A1E4THH2_9ASCO|nr:glycoside hydrolase family 16 protein [Tortispora caseinolytica NRRL Y-17796]
MNKINTRMVMVILSFSQLASGSLEAQKKLRLNHGLLESLDIDFTKGESEHFEVAGEGVIEYGKQGLEFSITNKSHYPMLWTTKYMLFGSVEADIIPATGKGIVSFVELVSDVDDEIDIEWLGGKPNMAESNFFRLGNTTTWDRCRKHKVATSHTRFHRYRIDWTPEGMSWSIDGKQVRKLRRKDTTQYPTTPMRIKIGTWIGGLDSNPPGTITWAGGLTKFDKAPFTMTVKRISIRNMLPCKGYKYIGRKNHDLKSLVLVYSNGSGIAASEYISGGRRNILEQAWVCLVTVLAALLLW